MVRKQKRWKALPAACLMAQMQRNAPKRLRRIRKKYENSDSPGKLYTYVSAGNIETPRDVYTKEASVPHRMSFVVWIALLLVLIWFCF